MRFFWVIVVLTTILCLKTSAHPTHHNAQPSNGHHSNNEPTNGHHLNQEENNGYRNDETSHGNHQNYETGQNNKDKEDCDEENNTPSNDHHNEHEKKGHQGDQLMNEDSNYKSGHENSEQWNDNNQNEHLQFDVPHHGLRPGHQDYSELWKKYQNAPQSMGGPHGHGLKNHPSLPRPSYHPSRPSHINLSHLPHNPELLHNPRHYQENYPKVNLETLGIDDIQKSSPNVQFVHIPRKNGKHSLVSLPVGVHPSKVKIFYPGQDKGSEQPVEIKPKHHHTLEPQYIPKHHSEIPIIPHDVPGPEHAIDSTQSISEAHATSTSEVVNKHPLKPHVKPHHGYNYGPVQKPIIPHYPAPHILKHPLIHPSENQAQAEASASAISVDNVPDFKPHHVPKIPIHYNVPKHDSIPVDHGWEETRQPHYKPHHEVPISYMPHIPKHKQPMHVNTAQAEATAEITESEHELPELVHKNPHTIVPVPTKPHSPKKPVEHKPVFIPHLPKPKHVKSPHHDAESAHIPKNKKNDSHLSKFSEFIERFLHRPHHDKRDSANIAKPKYEEKKEYPKELPNTNDSKNTKEVTENLPSDQEAECDESITTVEATASSSSTVVSNSAPQIVPVEESSDNDSAETLSKSHQIIPNHDSQWPQIAKLLREVVPLRSPKLKSSFPNLALGSPKLEKDEDILDDDNPEVDNGSPNGQSLPSTSSLSPSKDDSDKLVETTYTEVVSKAEATITKQVLDTDKQSEDDEPIHSTPDQVITTKPEEIPPKSNIQKFHTSILPILDSKKAQPTSEDCDDSPKKNTQPQKTYPSKTPSYSDDEIVTKAQAIAESETKVFETKKDLPNPTESDENDTEGWYYVMPGKHHGTHSYTPISAANNPKKEVITSAKASVQTTSSLDAHESNDKGKSKASTSIKSNEPLSLKSLNPSTTSSTAEAIAKSVTISKTSTSSTDIASNPDFIIQNQDDGSDDDQSYWQTLIPSDDQLSDDIVEPVSPVISTQAVAQSKSSVSVSEPQEENIDTKNWQPSQPKAVQKIPNYRTADRNEEGKKKQKKPSPFDGLIQSILNLNNLQKAPPSIEKKPIYSGKPQKSFVKSEAIAKSFAETDFSESGEEGDSSGKLNPLDFFIKLVLSTKEVLDKERS